MKKLLGWATVAMFVGMLMYFAGVALGLPASYLSGAAVAITLIGGLIDRAGLLFGACLSLGTAFIVALGFTEDVLPLVALLALLIIAVVAFVVAMKNRIDFGWALIVYQVEGLGLYATLKLGLWWPAAIAALILGLWWLALWRSEKRSLQLASV